VWAGSVLLRIGERRDLLVAVQADDGLTLDLLHTLFANWIDPGLADGAAALRPAFGIRLGSSADVGRSGAPRMVPQVRYGSKVIARSRAADDIVRSLACVLGGAHLQRPDDGRVWIAMRPFALGASAVLVDAEPPRLVNDPQLARSDIVELAAWSVLVDEDGSIALPPPLPRLDWAGIGVEAPADQWRRFRLAGIVVADDRDPDDAGLASELRRHSVRRHWGDALASLAAADRLATAADQRSMRAHVARLLDGTNGPDR
jgi:hypothetical protein